MLRILTNILWRQKKNSVNQIIQPAKASNEFNNRYDPTQPEHAVIISKVKDAFFLLKMNKISGYNDISSNVHGKCFGNLHKSLLYIFNLSLQTVIFLDDSKIVRITMKDIPCNGLSGC